MTHQKTNYMPIILTLSLGTLIGCMNLSLFSVAMAPLMEIFHTDVSTVQWLASGYMLAAGVITPAAAFLGGRFSYKKTLLMVTFLTFILAIVGCFSWCIEALIVVRILFGLTSGLLMPLTMGMLYQVVPAREQGKAAAIWGTSNLVGGVTPAVLSGLIITYLTWQFLFLIMVPLTLLMLFCTVKFIPADQVQGSQKLDVFGFTITAIGSFILLFAFSNLAVWGFSTKFFLITIVGIILLAIYVKQSWGKEDAMLNLSVLKYPRYVAAVIADGLNLVALYMMTFVMPMFLQRGLGINAAITGLMMLPGALFSAGAMPFATKILNGRGEKALVLTGVTVIVLGSIPLYHPWMGMPILLILAAMCIRNFGNGFMNLLSTNTSMAAVPRELTGHASALTNWMRQMVGALSTSIASNVIAFRLVTANASTAAETASVYVSTTGLMIIVTNIMMLSILPIGMKYFRGKKEMDD